MSWLLVIVLFALVVINYYYIDMFQKLNGDVRRMIALLKDKNDAGSKKKE